MIFNGLKKVIASTLVLTVFLNPVNLAAQDSSSGVLDDSLNDLYIVLGTGAAGALLGLSTLSFADKPKDKIKNVSIGGAIGIVLGVGIALFSQASKSHAAIVQTDYPKTMLAPETVESMSRVEFGLERVAQKYTATPTFGMNFTF